MARPANPIASIERRIAHLKARIAKDQGELEKLEQVRTILTSLEGKRPAKPKPKARR